MYPSARIGVGYLVLTINRLRLPDHQMPAATSSHSGRLINKPREDRTRSNGRLNRGSRRDPWRPYITRDASPGGANRSAGLNTSELAGTSHLINGLPPPGHQVMLRSESQFVLNPLS